MTDVLSDRGKLDTTIAPQFSNTGAVGQPDLGILLLAYFVRAAMLNVGMTTK
jgi:hypothetical protein